MKSNPAFLFLVLPALLIISTSSAFGMWCNDRLVSIGDTKAEVLSKCGAPSHANVLALETVKQADPGGMLAVEVPVEQWTYNQGPNTLLKILTFKGGRLTGIADGERVVETPEPRSFQFVIGDSQADILQKFGEPLFRDVTGTVTEKSHPTPATTVEREAKVELWTYDFGPGTLLKLLTFKDGRLVKIEDGERR